MIMLIFQQQIPSKLGVGIQTDFVKYRNQDWQLINFYNANNGTRLLALWEYPGDPVPER